MNKAVGLLCVLVIVTSGRTYGTDYAIIAKRSIKIGTDFEVQNKLTSKLVYTREHSKDHFTVSCQTSQVWGDPRTNDGEAEPDGTGTPMDGTPFVPENAQIVSISFSTTPCANDQPMEGGTKSGRSHARRVDRATEEQNTQDLINLIFYKGDKATFQNADLAKLHPKRAKEGLRGHAVIINILLLTE